MVLSVLQAGREGGQSQGTNVALSFLDQLLSALCQLVRHDFHIQV